MKIEKQALEDHQVKLTVEVEPPALEEAKKRAARQVARRVKIPGFRPGKAPYQVVLRQVGEAAILEEAIELLVEDIYPKVLDESGVTPFGPGSLENIVSMDPPVLEFIVPLEAEVNLGDYRAVRRPYEPRQVSEDEVDKVLQNLRERQAVIEPVDRSAQEGDMVYVRLSGVRKNPVEGEDATLIRERSMPVIVQKEEPVPESEDDPEEAPSAASEWPFPGFSRHLIGLSPKDELTLEHTFGEDAQFDTLRGVEAEFHLVVEEVKSHTLPELNDEFATTLGEFTSLEELRDEIRQNLEQEVLDAYNEEYDEHVIGEVVDMSEIQYPPQMLEREIDSLIDNLVNRLERQNMDMDIYLKSREISMEDLREEAKPVAETRLKKTLALFELAEVEQIQVENAELQQETMRTLERITRGMPEDEMKKYTNETFFKNLVSNVAADMMARQAAERLREISSGQFVEPIEEPVEDNIAAAPAEPTPEETPQVEAGEETGPADLSEAPSSETS